MARGLVAQVLPDSRVPQLDRLFDYVIPRGMRVEPGMSVRVPIGRGGRLATGWVVRVVAESQFAGQLAEIEQVVSDVPLLTPEVYQLARAVAARQAGGIADVLRLAIAKRAVRVEKSWRETKRDQVDLPPDPGPSQCFDRDTIARLLGPAARTRIALPYGVTSRGGHPVPVGMVELAHLAASSLAAGRSAIICVPDWRQLGSLKRILDGVVDGQSVAVFDSDETPSRRYGTYLRCLEGRPVIAVGSRHAIYAPVSNLGLIIVVDDGDSSHFEPLAPYPHTRDIALIRSQQSSSALVLADHSPSVEVLRFIQMGFFDEVLPRNPSRPRVIPTALTTAAGQSPGPARLPSLAHRAIAGALDEGPVLVQVFRAGYAPGAVCASCRERARCLQCGGPLGVPGAKGAPRCGWCKALGASWECPHCHHRQLRPVGQGVGRTVAELGKAFPGVTIIQSDGEHRVESVPDKSALVVATRGAEPLAAGGYAAALFLDGEAMLQRAALGAVSETLAAWESALTLLRPTATAYLTDLDGPVAAAVAGGGVVALLQRELHERHTLRLPPTVRLATIEGPGDTVDELSTRICALDPQITTIGAQITGDGSSRVVLRVPYAGAPEVAQILRAEVVRHATARRRGVSALRATMDDLASLDQLAGLAQ